MMNMQVDPKRWGPIHTFEAPGGLRASRIGGLVPSSHLGAVPVLCEIQYCNLSVENKICRSLLCSAQWYYMAVYHGTNLDTVVNIPWYIHGLVYLGVLSRPRHNASVVIGAEPSPQRNTSLELAAV